MNRKIKVDDIHFNLSSSQEIKNGQLGRITCTLNDVVQIKGITIRYGPDRGLHLNFPAQQKPNGRPFFYVRPKDDQIRHSIERQIFNALGVKK